MQVSRKKHASICIWNPSAKSFRQVIQENVDVLEWRDTVTFGASDQPCKTCKRVN
jgi:hypothetical protein